MASERLKKLSQPLKRRVSKKYEQWKQINEMSDNLNRDISNKTSTSNNSSVIYKRISSLAEPRFRREKYVNPDSQYSKSLKKDYKKYMYHTNATESSPSETSTGDDILRTHFDNQTEKKSPINKKPTKMEPSDQITRMNQKTYVASPPEDEGKTAKQLLQQRLNNLATPRHRRNKYIDTSIQQDVSYTSNLRKQPSTSINDKRKSSLYTSSQQYNPKKEVLQLAEDTKPIYNNTGNNDVNCEITELIIPNYLREKNQIDGDIKTIQTNDHTSKQIMASPLIHEMTRSSNNFNPNDDDDVFNMPFTKTPSELRFVKQQIILSRKFKTKVLQRSKYPTTIIWHYSKLKKNYRDTSMSSVLSRHKNNNTTDRLL